MEEPRGRKELRGLLIQIDINSCLLDAILAERDAGKVKTSELKRIGRVLKHWRMLFF